MGLIVLAIALACTVVLIGIGLRIGAAILRTAVRLTNATLGGRDLEEGDYRHRASLYQAIPQPKTLGGILIPMPGVGYAILVNLACSLIAMTLQVAATYGAVFAFDLAVPEFTDVPDAAALSAALGVIGIAVGANLFGTVLVLKMALPTTFIRAGVVVVWQIVICVVLAVILCGVLFAVGAMAGGGMSLPSKPAAGGWVR